MYEASETTVHALRTAETAASGGTREWENQVLKNPLYEHSENSTKNLGGKK